MTKPSTDTATELAIANYRKDGTLPKRMTLRFLALLQKKELAQLARTYRDLKDQGVLAKNLRLHAQGFYELRFERIQSERRQRGHIK